MSKTRSELQSLAEGCKAGTSEAEWSAVAEVLALFQRSFFPVLHCFRIFVYLIAVLSEIYALTL